MFWLGVSNFNWRNKKRNRELGQKNLIPLWEAYWLILSQSMLQMFAYQYLRGINVLINISGWKIKNETNIHIENNSSNYTNTIHFYGLNHWYSEYTGL